MTVAAEHLEVVQCALMPRFGGQQAEIHVVMGFDIPRTHGPVDLSELESADFARPSLPFSFP